MSKDNQEREQANHLMGILAYFVRILSHVKFVNYTEGVFNFICVSFFFFLPYFKLEMLLNQDLGNLSLSL